MEIHLGLLPYPKENDTSEEASQKNCLLFKHEKNNQTLSND
jgi:hypothetical protein